MYLHFSSLSAFFVCDRIGRIWATRQLCLLWILGISIFMGNNGSLGAVYAGRFIAGLGIGQTTVVGPVYLAEISPASIRGLCTCIFTGFVYIGIVLAYFANYGVASNLGDKSHVRWVSFSDWRKSWSREKLSGCFRGKGRNGKEKKRKILSHACCVLKILHIY